MDNLAASLGNLLRELRQKKGISQEALAADSDLDRTYISMVERGERMPTIRTLFKISRGLDIKPSGILRDLEQRVDF